MPQDVLQLLIRLLRSEIPYSALKSINLILCSFPNCSLCFSILSDNKLLAFARFRNSEVADYLHFDAFSPIVLGLNWQHLLSSSSRLFSSCYRMHRVNRHRLKPRVFLVAVDYWTWHQSAVSCCARRTQELLRQEATNAYVSEQFIWALTRS